VYLLAAFLIFGACAWMGEGASEGTASSVSEGFGTVAEPERDLSSDEVSSETTDVPLIYVYVYGAVQSPGLYSLPKGSRAYEAVALAGGYLPDADPASLNPASFVSDEEMLYVARIGESVTSGETVSGDGLIDLNRAGSSELMSLPGIGEQKAEAIIRYREEHGEFRSIEDIMLVSGIGESIFERIREKIKV